VADTGSRSRTRATSSTEADSRKNETLIRARSAWLAIVLLGTAVALLAGPRGPLGEFWRPLHLNPEPAGLQVAGLAFSTAVEAVGFGLAIAVLALGRPVFAHAVNSSPRCATAQLATVWLLGSWWPHTALHMHFGLQAAALSILELTFHAGSVLAFLAFLWAFLLQPRREVNDQPSRSRDD
jgi:hypothetical protein